MELLEELEAGALVVTAWPCPSTPAVAGGNGMVGTSHAGVGSGCFSVMWAGTPGEGLGEASAGELNSHLLRVILRQ